MPALICFQILRWQFANELRRFPQERSQTHESFSAPLFEKAINARISTLSEKAVVLRQLNRKPTMEAKRQNLLATRKISSL
jgi:hypothetical protein